MDSLSVIAQKFRSGLDSVESERAPLGQLEVAMSTLKGSIAIQPCPPDRFLQPAVQIALPSVRVRVWQRAVTKRHPVARPFGAFFLECWRRMKVMHAAFEQSQSAEADDQVSEARRGSK